MNVYKISPDMFFRESAFCKYPKFMTETNEFEIRIIDGQADQVLELVKEVTRPHNMAKADYLKRILENGSRRAKLLKCADRISNLTDLHRDTHSDQKITDYLDQTEKWVIPMAKEVNGLMRSN